MRIFVASWFFPPSTSSEGLVTYKLLRHSSFEYDVFSSTSQQWGYKSKTSINNEPNIHCYSIETDSIDEWVDACIKCFTELNSTYHYDCIMTRSTPPESILVGKAIKEKYPEIKWIASFGDPVGNNPYELKAYVYDSQNLTEAEKESLLVSLRSRKESDLEKWEEYDFPEIQLLCKLKRWENYALRNADLIIAPTARQLQFITEDNTWLPKYYAVPHSYDSSFFHGVQSKDSADKVKFVYTGYSDALRSLEPLVDAVKWLKHNNSPVLEKLCFIIAGNTPRAIVDKVINEYLDDYFIFLDGMDYYKSLELMQQADWLIHIDAYFNTLLPGGSIFFAGKLADYFGTDKPIFALTGTNTPAYNMISMAGGICHLSREIEKIALSIENIIIGKYVPEINKEYRERFSAEKVAKSFDERVNALFPKQYVSSRKVWPTLPPSNSQKILSICVPSYNAQTFLDRCLHTLTTHSMAAYEEVLVINDGSKDFTADIAAEYEKKYPGIVRLINKENGGHGSAVNRAIEEAKGLYFKNVDSDDWVDSGKLEKLIKAIMNQEVTSDLISSDYDEIDLFSGHDTPMCAGKSIEYNKQYHFDTINPEDCYFTIHSLTIKTEILKQMPLKLQEHTFFVDCEYILFPIPFVNDFVFLKDRIYKYSRGNPDQSVDISNMVRRYDHHDRVLRRVLKYSVETAMDADKKLYYDSVLRRLLNTHFQLSLVYDENKMQGYGRAADFYSYLKDIRPDLAEWVVGHDNNVKRAYKNNFICPKRELKKVAPFPERVKAKISHFSNTTTGKKILYNPLTHAIAHSPIIKIKPVERIVLFLVRSKKRKK